MLTAREIITVDPEIVGGKPVFSGTQVPVRTLFDHLEESSLDDILTAYPSVDREPTESVLLSINV